MANLHEMITLAERITAVSSFKTEHPLRELLQVLCDELPIRMVTLWKIKLDSGFVCARERVSVDYAPDPTDTTDEYEFVCPLEKTILSKATKSSAFTANEPIDLDISDMSRDAFFLPSDRARNLHLKTCVLAPVPLLNDRTTAQIAPFFLAIYPKTPDFKVASNDTQRKLLRAIQNKASSTLSSLIEIRTNRITTFFTAMPKLSGALTIRSILKETIEKLLPKELSYERAYIFWRDMHSTNYEIVEARSMDLSTLTATESETKELNEYASALHQGVTVTHSTQLKDTYFGDASSVISAPIHNKLSPERPMGYIVLVTKLCPLARRLAPHSQIRDYFDWEDVAALDHVTSMIGFISELLLSEERRKLVASQIAHETLMPATYIFGTAEDFLDKFDSHTALPRQKRKSYLQNIYHFSALQLALVRGVLLGLTDENRPPAQRYKPQLVDLQSLGREVARMTFPLCQKQRVKNDNIYVHPLARLFVDRVALTQIFLNLMTNSIKYKGQSIDYERFRISVTGEHAPISVIPDFIRVKHSLDSESFPEIARDTRFNEGFLVSIEDDGVGIPHGFEEKIFERHFRVPGVEQHEPRGSGLGLAIVRRIVREHFGAIWVDNRANPTRFCIYFPRILFGPEYIRHLAWTKGR